MVLALGWFWLRDSSLVKVEHVTVTGVTGPDAARIRGMLTDAAHDMTTLHVSQGDLRNAVASNGQLLRAVQPGNIATIQMGNVPGGDRLTDPRASQAVELLAAAPSALRAKVENVWSGSHGLTARLTNGPLLYFGSADRLAAKWVAVATVLPNPDAAGALYLDVRIPERTAAGGLASPDTSQPSTGG